MSKINLTKYLKLTQYELSPPKLPTFLERISDDNNIIDKAIESLSIGVEGSQKLLTSVVNKMNEMDTQITLNTANITNISVEIGKIQKDVESLKPATIHELAGRVATNEKNIKSNSELLHALTDRVTDDEDNIKQHEIRISALEEKTESWEDIINNIPPDLTEVVEKLQNDVTIGFEAVNNTLTSVNTELKSHAHDIAILKANVQGLQDSGDANALQIQIISNNVDNLQERMSFTEDKVIKLEMCCEQVNASLSDINDAITKMQETIDSLQPISIEGLQNQVNKNTEDIATANQTIEDNQRSVSTALNSQSEQNAEFTSKIDTLESDVINNMSEITDTIIKVNALTDKVNTIETTVPVESTVPVSASDKVIGSIAALTDGKYTTAEEIKGYSINIPGYVVNSWLDTSDNTFKYSVIDDLPTTAKFKVMIW